MRNKCLCLTCQRRDNTTCIKGCMICLAEDAHGECDKVQDCYKYKSENVSRETVEE